MAVIPNGMTTGSGDTQELYDDDYEEDPMETAEMDCGLHSDGQCGLAGTEHCDFICPFRDSEDFAGSEAWCKKHNRKR